MAETKRSTKVKKVNVHAPIPIRTVVPPIHGDLKGVCMSPSNILKCLIGKATVHEVLSDGSLLKLNMKNYNTDNKPIVKKDYSKMKNSVAKPKSAINKAVEKPAKKIVLSDHIDLTDKIVDRVLPEVNVADAKPESINIEIEKMPNLIEDKEAPMIMAQYSEDTVTAESTTEENK